MAKSRYGYLNEFPIVDFLHLLQREPHRKYGAEWAYFSPWREETTPSVSVNTQTNVWIDFGLGRVGGRLLALAERIFKTDFATAARLVEQMLRGRQPRPIEAPVAPALSPWGYVPIVPECRKRVVRMSAPRNGSVLWAYLVGRGIDVEAVRRCGGVWERLREVSYWSNSVVRQARPNFALGLRNEAGGYELFSKGFKSSIGGKTYTLIPGSQPGIAIFEGVMDLLSAITKTHQRLKGKWAGFQMSVLVLHSANHREKARDAVRGRGSIFYYGDNDAAGQATADYYRKVCRGQDFYDERQKYRGYKDYNDWLLGKKAPPGKLPARGQAPSLKAQTSRRWVWAVFDATATGKERECTYYNYTNDEQGKVCLETLRNRFTPDVKVIRFCTRISGRKFSFEQLNCQTGRVSNQDTPPRPENPGSWGRPPQRLSRALTPAAA